jgi:hypothetical protein
MIARGKAAANDKMNEMNFPFRIGKPSCGSGS